MNLPERLSLARLPTPVVPLERLSARVGKRIWLWRDDLTGAVESGNKIRKLELFAADALAAGATRLITCGGPQSNHARATAYVARRLGLDVTLVVREPREGMDHAAPATGNQLLSRIMGADVRFVPFADYAARGGVYDGFLEEERQRAAARGERPYVVPEGGSSALGSLGYVHGVEEMRATWSRLGTGKPHPDALFCAVGSGGTLAGLILGYARLGLPTDTVHAVNVCDSAAFFQRKAAGLCDDAAARFGLPRPHGVASVFDGHFGEGYARATDDDLRFYAELARLEGVLLDPVYTGKAFRGMLREIEKDPRRFGDDVLFLHSGGLFGTFAFAAQYAGALAGTP